MCLVQGHDAVMPMRLEPAAPRSRVKHSTTEPLRSQYIIVFFSYPSVLAYVLGTQKNRLIEMVLLSTHKICFGQEIRK